MKPSSEEEETYQREEKLKNIFEKHQSDRYLDFHAFNSFVAELDLKKSIKEINEESHSQGLEKFRETIESFEKGKPD